MSKYLLFLLAVSAFGQGQVGGVGQPMNGGNSIILTTTGTTGPATLIGNTFNIPQYVGVSAMSWPAAPGIAIYAGSAAWGTSLAAPTGTIVGTSDTQTLTNKTVDGVTPTVFGYIDPTSSIQTQLNAKGTGTVSTLSAGTLLPLFSSAVGTPTTTPALTFSLQSAGANTSFGNFTGSTAVPSYTANTGSGSPVAATSPSIVTANLNTPSALNCTNCTAIPGAQITGAASIPAATLPAALSSSTSVNGTSIPAGVSLMTTNTALLAAQEPAHTGDTTNAVGSLALTTMAVTLALPNAAAGTSAGSLVKKVDTSGTLQVTKTATTDINNALGIVKSGYGTTGTAQISVLGAASGLFDNVAITDGDFVIVSTTVAGTLSDAGATLPPGVLNLGVVNGSHASCGTPPCGPWNVILMTPDAIGAAGAGPMRAIGATFTASGGLVSGFTGYVTVPFACTINAWNILVDTGTATVDIWKIATGTAIPTVANTITASAIPAITTGTAIHSTTLTGWTTTVAANNIFGFNLKAVSSATQVNASIGCQ